MFVTGICSTEDDTYIRSFPLEVPLAPEAPLAITLLSRERPIAMDEYSRDAPDASSYISTNLTLRDLDSFVGDFVCKQLGDIPLISVHI